MPLTAAAPPQPVPVFSGFDYVTVDETRHRAYAAHTRSQRLLIVDTSTGAVAGQVDVGPMHGVAVDPATGNVFTGNGTDNTLSKVDPVAMKVLASVDVPGNIDDIVYDPGRGRVYASEDSGSRVFVIDGATMKLLGTVATESKKLEAPDVDPATGVLYQNLADRGSFAMIDPATMKISKIVKTPQLQNNHPLIFSKSANQVIVGGTNGVLSSYTPDGTHVGDVAVQPHIDQCSTGSKGALIACAGSGIVTIVTPKAGAAPAVLARFDTRHQGVHTIGIDETGNDVWVVWSDERGDWVQRLRWTP